jgi:hypothetical protein
MKLHEVQPVSIDNINHDLRTAVPGGWWYQSRGYNGAPPSSGIFVPDPTAPHVVEARTELLLQALDAAGAAGLTRSDCTAIAGAYTVIMAALGPDVVQRDEGSARRLWLTEHAPALPPPKPPKAKPAGRPEP